MPVVLTHIFRGLESYRISGEPLEMFERANDMLDGNGDSTRSFPDVVVFFCSVCGVLAKEGGLGCGEEVLDQIDDFVVGLLETFEAECAIRNITYRNIVVSYSKVFSPTTHGHMETQRRIWNRLPVEIKVGIATELMHFSRAAASGASSPLVFLTALRELSVL